MDRSRRTYTVTTKRVIMEAGFLSKNSDEVRIKDVRSINLRRSGFLGLLGIGDLEFSSAAADQAEITFHAVPGVERVRELVRKHQEV